MRPMSMTLSLRWRREEQLRLKSESGKENLILSFMCRTSTQSSVAAAAQAHYTTSAKSSCAHTTFRLVAATIFNFHSEVQLEVPESRKSSLSCRLSSTTLIIA